MKILVSNEQFTNGPLLHDVINSDNVTFSDYEVTYDAREDFDFVVPSNVPYAALRLLGDIEKNHPSHPCLLGIDKSLLYKKGILNRVTEAGLEAVDTFENVSLDNINHFSNTAFIIKPDLGARHSHPLNCTYKIYDNANAFLSTVDSTELATLLADGESFVIQQSLADGSGKIHQLFACCFVNSNSEVYINHISNVYMEYDPRQEEVRAEQGDQAARAQYINNFLRLEDSFSDATDTSDPHGFRSQIQALATHCGLKNMPFAVQALVDPADSTKCYITDFSYALRPLDFAYSERYSFIADKLDFMYKDIPVSTPDTLHYKYITLDIPSGINVDLETYCSEHEIHLIEKWSRFDPTERKNTTFLITDNSQSGVVTKLTNLKAFLLTN